MRLATILEAGRAASPRAAIVEAERCLPLAAPGVPRTVRGLAAAGEPALARVRAWAAARDASAWLPLGAVRLGPAIPDPGAVYTIGDNYRAAGGGPADPDPGRPPRPLVYGKAASSVAGTGATLDWDRAISDDVDAEVELGVVIGAPAWRVPPDQAGAHVFGYTIVDDVSARDARLDGDQWLVGKSMPGFCPVGPWVVTADALDPSDLALRCDIGGAAIQDGRTSQMRFPVAEIVSYLSHHLVLRPGDLIATGTPPRLAAPPGPGRRLRPGDVVRARIEGIGELVTHVA